mgnify:FL=1
MRDDVDRLVEAWQRERPDVDVAPLEVLSRVTRIARQLDILRRASFTADGLEPWEFDMLAALRRAGAEATLSPGQLGAETMVTSGTITNRVDRLESRGLVRRQPDPDDRRGVRVALTDSGRDLVDRALVDWVERERIVLDGLTAGEQEHLAACLRTIVHSMESDTSVS